MKFDGAAFKKLEGLNVGILKFFPKYYLLRYGISRRFEWEHEEEDPFRRFDRDGDNTGVEYNRAYHQWNAFHGWLTNHPEACESSNQFEVSSFN